MQLLLQRSYMLMNEVHISSASVDVPLEDSTSWKCYLCFLCQAMCTKCYKIFFLTLCLIVPWSSSLSCSTVIALWPRVFPRATSYGTVLICITFISILLGSVLKHLTVFACQLFHSYALYQTTSYY